MMGSYGGILSRLAAAAVLVLSVQAGAAPVKGKKPVKITKPLVSPLTASLTEQGPQIQDCAAKLLDKGAKKVDVKVSITINKGGELVNSQVDVTVEGGDQAVMRSCVETALKAAKFPKVSTPLAKAEKSWSIMSQ